MRDKKIRIRVSRCNAFVIERQTFLHMCKDKIWMALCCLWININWDGNMILTFPIFSTSFEKSHFRIFGILLVLLLTKSNQDEHSLFLRQQTIVFIHLPSQTTPPLNTQPPVNRNTSSSRHRQVDTKLHASAALIYAALTFSRLYRVIICMLPCLFGRGCTEPFTLIAFEPFVLQCSPPES